MRLIDISFVICWFVRLIQFSSSECGGGGGGGGGGDGGVGGSNSSLFSDAFSVTQSTQHLMKR
jgi:hypothetical protein